MFKVDTLEEGLKFYAERLGHELIWKTATAAGLKLPHSHAELVISTEHGPETDIKVKDAKTAFEEMIAAGASPIAEPFEISIGYCAVVADPWGNRITILDTAKGLLKVDNDKNVINK